MMLSTVARESDDVEYCPHILNHSSRKYDAMENCSWGSNVQIEVPIISIDVVTQVLFAYV
jgi:hypothetical protein